MKRVTIICPAALLSDTRHLLMALGSGLDEGATLRPDGWEILETGDAVAVASTEVPEAWISGVQHALVRPDWDESAEIDMEAAERARLALRLSDGSDSLGGTPGGSVHAIHGWAPLDACAFAGVAPSNSDG